MDALFFALGLLALVLGAELLVRGASRLALSCGVSPLVVGLTVVAFGTSAPEVAVSVGSALRGNSDVAVGNVVGSNIFNVLFILGAAALVRPLAVHLQIVAQEVPIMVGASVLLVAHAADGVIDRVEAAMLFALLLVYLVFVVRQSRARQQAGLPPGHEAAQVPRGGWDRHWAVQLLLVFAGLALLVLGAEWLVGAAVAFARALGVSDVVIGLTVVAAGTSLPEVATSVLATMRGERDIAIGNVVGSNTFNILGCLGITGVVSPGPLLVAPDLQQVDLWAMLGVAFACVPLLLSRNIGRAKGLLLLGWYGAYTTCVVLAATHSSALPAWRWFVLSLALPATVVLVIAALVRRNRGGATTA